MAYCKPTCQFRTPETVAETLRLAGTDMRTSHGTYYELTHINIRTHTHTHTHTHLFLIIRPKEVHVIVVVVISPAPCGPTLCRRLCRAVFLQRLLNPRKTGRRKSALIIKEQVYCSKGHACLPERG